jgi:hypothetical protein
VLASTRAADRADPSGLARGTARALNGINHTAPGIGPERRCATYGAQNCSSLGACLRQLAAAGRSVEAVRAKS